LKNNHENGKHINKSSLILLAVCVLVCLNSVVLRHSSDTKDTAADQTAITAETGTETAAEDALSVQDTTPDVTSSAQETSSEDTLSPQDTSSEDTASIQEASADDTSSVQYAFRTDSQWESHYQKHGIEMGFADKEAYLEAANRVVNNKASLHKEEAEDGDDVYYLEETNEFVIVSTDGYIRTYFYPSAGKAYYDRQ
jgi:pyocin large subunit-like protein